MGWGVTGGTEHHYPPLAVLVHANMNVLSLRYFAGYIWHSVRWCLQACLKGVTKNILQIFFWELGIFLHFLNPYAISFLKMYNTWGLSWTIFVLEHKVSQKSGKNEENRYKKMTFLSSKWVFLVFLFAINCFKNLFILNIL